MKVVLESNDPDGIYFKFTMDLDKEMDFPDDGYFRPFFKEKWHNENKKRIPLEFPKVEIPPDYWVYDRRDILPFKRPKNQP